MGGFLLLYYGWRCKFDAAMVVVDLAAVAADLAMSYLPVAASCFVCWLKVAT